MIDPGDLQDPGTRLIRAATAVWIAVIAPQLRELRRIRRVNVAFRTEQVESALKHLREQDKVLRKVIATAGDFTLKPKRDRFAMLVQSIISQQISTSAATSIRRRLMELLAPEKVSAAALLKYSPEQLREAGVSPQKAGYILDLCRCVTDGTVKLNQIGRLTDEKVIEELTKIRGIGVWTAQMFLMFSLGRPDVFPVGDLGIRNGIGKMYGFDERPSEAECLEIASRWAPYRTIASWYCWRILEGDDEW